MSILEFPSLSDTPGPYILTRVDNQDESHAVIDNPTLMDAGSDDHSLYRATLKRGERTVDVVCKLTYGKSNRKDMRHEAVTYLARLRKLQGEYVPVFHGYYEGEMEDEEVAGCLITEYCGERSKVPFFGMQWDLKMAVLRALVRVHRAGVQHGDFSERNVLIDVSGKPFIIDFEQATAHKCGQAIKIKRNQLEPEEEDFGCEELYDACLNLGIWKQRYVRYLHRDYSIEGIKSPEDLVKRAADFIQFKKISPARALLEAKETLAEYSLQEKWRKTLDWEAMRSW